MRSPARGKADSTDAGGVSCGVAGMTPPLNFNEQQLYTKWFRELAGNDERIPGKIAATFLAKSSLPNPQLRAIWDECDTAKAGSIDSSQFNTAMRLISLAQNGRDPTVALCSTLEAPPPLPRFQNVSYAPPPQPATVGPTAGAFDHLQMEDAGEPNGHERRGSNVSQTMTMGAMGGMGGMGGMNTPGSNQGNHFNTSSFNNSFGNRPASTDSSGSMGLHQQGQLHSTGFAPHQQQDHGNFGFGGGGGGLGGGGGMLNQGMGMHGMMMGQGNSGHASPSMAPSLFPGGGGGGGGGSISFPSPLFPMAHSAMSMTSLPTPDASNAHGHGQGHGNGHAAAATVPAERFQQQQQSDVGIWSLEEYKGYAYEFSTADDDKDGYITGQQGAQLLSQSGLPKEDLRVIWSLADSGKIGKLDCHGFAVAKHLISERTRGCSLPAVLPAHMQDPPRGPEPLLTAPPAAPAALSASMPSPEQQPLAGAGQTAMFQDALTPRQGLTNAQGATQGQHGLAMTAEEYTSFVGAFAPAHPDSEGKMTGSEARELLGQSGLPTQDLRKIWVLADMTKDGKLDSHEFAIAMYLIHRRQAGDALPASLPPSLAVPPRTATPPSGAGPSSGASALPSLMESAGGASAGAQHPHPDYSQPLPLPSPVGIQDGFVDAAPPSGAMLGFADAASSSVGGDMLGLASGRAGQSASGSVPNPAAIPGGDMMFGSGSVPNPAAMPGGDMMFGFGDEAHGAAANAAAPPPRPSAPPPPPPSASPPAVPAHQPPSTVPPPLPSHLHPSHIPPPLPKAAPPPLPSRGPPGSLPPALPAASSPKSHHPPSVPSSSHTHSPATSPPPPSAPQQTPPRSPLPASTVQVAPLSFTPHDYQRHATAFSVLDPSLTGFVSGATAKPFLKASGLSSQQLRSIWNLGDVTKDGRLDMHEYAIIQLLIEHCQAGGTLPASLPTSLKEPPQFAREQEQKQASASASGGGGGGGGGGAPARSQSGSTHTLSVFDAFADLEPASADTSQHLADTSQHSLTSFNDSSFGEFTGGSSAAAAAGGAPAATSATPPDRGLSLGFGGFGGKDSEPAHAPSAASSAFGGFEEDPFGSTSAFSGSGGFQGSAPAPAPAPAAPLPVTSGLDSSFGFGSDDPFDPFAPNLALDTSGDALGQQQQQQQQQQSKPASSPFGSGFADAPEDGHIDEIVVHQPSDATAFPPHKAPPVPPSSRPPPPPAPVSDKSSSVGSNSSYDAPSSIYQSGSSKPPSRPPPPPSQPPPDPFSDPFLALSSGTPQNSDVDPFSSSAMGAAGSSDQQQQQKQPQIEQSQGSTASLFDDPFASLSSPVQASAPEPSANPPVSDPFKGHDPFDDPFGMAAATQAVSSPDDPFSMAQAPSAAGGGDLSGGSSSFGIGVQDPFGGGGAVAMNGGGGHTAAAAAANRSGRSSSSGSENGDVEAIRRKLAEEEAEIERAEMDVRGHERVVSDARAELRDEVKNLAAQQQRRARLLEVLDGVVAECEACRSKLLRQSGAAGAALESGDIKGWAVLTRGGGGGGDKAAAAAKVSFGGGQGVFSVEDYQLSLLKVGDSRL